MKLKLSVHDALEKKKKNEDFSVDFTRAKRKLAEDIRLIRKILKERDELLNKKNNEADVTQEENRLILDID